MWVSACLCRSEISLELLDSSYLFKKVACVDGNGVRISVCGKLQKGKLVLIEPPLSPSALNIFRTSLTPSPSSTAPPKSSTSQSCSFMLCTSPTISLALLRHLSVFSSTSVGHLHRSWQAASNLSVLLSLIIVKTGRADTSISRHRSNEFNFCWNHPKQM